MRARDSISSGWGGRHMNGGRSMRDDDVSYFHRRINEEIERAHKSEDPIAARIHRDMAEHYIAALRGVGVEAPTLAPTQ